MEGEIFNANYEPRQSNNGGRFTWHTGFYDAIQLELSNYKPFLEYDIEYQLTDEPLRIDTVVIKKLNIAAYMHIIVKGGNENGGANGRKSVKGNRLY
jgi:hypothetical protein